MKTTRIECSTGEIVFSYDEYMKTRHWANFKKRCKQSKYAYECALCDADDRLQLHHKTYYRIGKERVNDCVWLCEDHHRVVHRSIDDGAKPRLSPKRKSKRSKEKKTDHKAQPLPTPSKPKRTKPQGMAGRYSDEYRKAMRN